MINTFNKIEQDDILFGLLDERVLEQVLGGGSLLVEEEKGAGLSR